MTEQEKREKVIKGLKWCMDEEHDCYIEQGCPYENEGEGFGCKYALHRDALELLKAQEPVDAIVVPNGIDRSGGWWYQCPSCKMEIKPRDRYCRNCGQAVKWE